ncbi:MAG TPA: class II aldolase/adducin family protein [Candidatus Avacidaminococcus intestinavium]|uniref:Class II aldolase/adducin family protein n=1 Tax=Candidatus Avacidaminococcus intestinavium TaxID=2840684 RepID=A0A9D1MQG4_9FIRM|nr:class II aldolase/adducin family protein [Candidatus Avacidaminococcus intestinavium]
MNKNITEQLRNLPLDALKKQIILTAQALLTKKLTSGSWGNISARITPDLIIITPSGKPYETLQESDLILVNSDGNIMAGNSMPSSELPLHLAIYKARPTCNAVIHTHSIYASVCAALHKPIPPLLEDTAQVAGGSINVARYALAGSQELADNTTAALGNADAVLLANHGAVCCARSLTESLFTAEIVEKSAQVFCAATTIGEVVPLPEADIKTLRTFYLEHYSKRQKGEE